LNTGLKILALVLLIIVGLESVLLTISYIQLDLKNKEISDLLNKLAITKNNYSKLSNKYSILTSSFDELNREYKALKDKYESLEREYNELRNKHSILETKYESLLSEYNNLYHEALTLNNSLAQIASTLKSHALLPEAFKHVLTIDEVKSVSTYVWQAGVDKDDIWKSYQAIYKWVHDNVRYIDDVPIPVPLVIHRFTDHNLYYYDFIPIENNAQNPLFTAKHREGDCEDQAILVYAMNYTY
jgi:archaellum component FlaC